MAPAAGERRQANYGAGWVASLGRWNGLGRGLRETLLPKGGQRQLTGDSFLLRGPLQRISPARSGVGGRIPPPKPSVLVPLPLTREAVHRRGCGLRKPPRGGSQPKAGGGFLHSSPGPGHKGSFAAPAQTEPGRRAAATRDRGLPARQPRPRAQRLVRRPSPNGARPSRPATEVFLHSSPGPGQRGPFAAPAQTEPGRRAVATEVFLHNSSGPGHKGSFAAPAQTEPGRRAAAT